jgi:hypothetical protein
MQRATSLNDRLSVEINFCPSFGGENFAYDKKILQPCAIAESLPLFKADIQQGVDSEKSVLKDW